MALATVFPCPLTERSGLPSVSCVPIFHPIVCRFAPTTDFRIRTREGWPSYHLEPAVWQALQVSRMQRPQRGWRCKARLRQNLNTNVKFIEYITFWLNEQIFLAALLVIFGCVISLIWVIKWIIGYYFPSEQRTQRILQRLWYFIDQQDRY